MTFARHMLIALALVIFALAIFAASPAQAGRRVGDKETLRVPAARTKLVASLLQRTAEADSKAAVEEARYRRALELRAAQEAAQRREVAMARAAAAAKTRQDTTIVSKPERTPGPNAAAQPVSDQAGADAPEAVVDAQEDDALPPLPPLEAKALPALAIGDRPAAEPISLASGDKGGLGGKAQIVFVVLGLIALGAWLLRRRRTRRDPLVRSSNLRLIGQTQVSGRWQVSLLELPGEILVLGGGEGGMQVLARVDDPERMEALRAAHSTSGGGFSRILRGLLDRSGGDARDGDQKDDNLGAAMESFTDNPALFSGAGSSVPKLSDAPAPAELLAADKAFALHRAFTGSAPGDSTGAAVGLREKPIESAPEPIEIELMKQRLADLRAGRFAQ